MKNNIKKDIFWNTLGTTFNSFNSLFFLIIVTRINGLNDAGIFTLGFSLACLFYTIGVYSGRTFQVTDIDKDDNDSNYFYSKIITCILMLLVSLLYCFIKNYSMYKFSIIYFLIVFKFLEAFSEYYYAIMQKNNMLFIVGKSLFYKSFFSLLLFFLFDFITNKIILSEIMIIFINIIFILFYDIKEVKKLGLSIRKFEKGKVLNILKNGSSAFLFTFLSLYAINSSKYSLDGITSNELQTIYGIIFMPATIMNLLAQFVIQPFVLKMKKMLYVDIQNFKKLNLKLCILLLILGGFVLVFAYLLGIPFLQIVYKINLIKYRIHLMIILLGATIYSLTIVLSTSLTTMRFTINQMFIFLITSIFAFFYSKFLISKYFLFGASLNYLFSMSILFILYFIVYKDCLRKIEDKNSNDIIK